MAPTNRGIVKIAQGKAILKEIPIPKVQDNFILVRTVAVALNPTDWQTLDDPFRPGTTQALLGCDAAGIVVEVGKNVTKKFKKGDRIAGFAHGGNDLHPEYGTFAEYIIMKGDISMHIPPNMTFEEAATLGCGIATVALGLYRYLGLPMLTLPLEEKESEGPPILIYGGSSASGTIAIQFAKLSGLKVITTSSQRNFELLKSLGADHVFDYHDPTCAEKIRAITKDNLQLVFDTIATPSSATICAEALSSTPSPDSIYVNLMGVELPRSDIRNEFFLGYTISGEPFEFEGTLWDAVPEDYELGKKFIAISEELVAQGKVKPHPGDVRVGIEGILDGMKELKEGKVSGAKLVYRVGTAL